MHKIYDAFAYSKYIHEARTQFAASDYEMHESYDALPYSKYNCKVRTYSAAPDY